MKPKKQHTPDPEPTSPRVAAQAEPMTPFKILIDEDAAADLAEISDAATREVISRRIFELDTEPLKQGKTLADDLKGLRSVRAAGQRYRVIYQVMMALESEDAGTVQILVIGIRREGSKKDVYKIASKRLG